jgi:hypothetical protein
MVVAINPPQQAFSRQATDPRDPFERNMDKLLRALQIANQGFGIAVDFKKIQNMPTAEQAEQARAADIGLKKTQLDIAKAEKEALPTPEEARQARQAGLRNVRSQTALIDQQTAQVKANIAGLGPKQKAEKLKGLDEHIQNFVKKSEVFKEGQAEVIGGKSLMDLSELARNGNQQALGLMKVAAARAKQGGQLTDKDIELTGQNRQIALAFKRFYNERIAGEVQIEDVNDLVELSDSLMASGFEKITNARATLASQRAKTTPFTEEELLGAATVQELVGFDPKGFLGRQDQTPDAQPTRSAPAAKVDQDVDELLRLRRQLGR